MNQSDKPYQNILAFGWVILAMLNAMSYVVALLQGAIQTDFSEFVYHPGPEGLNMICLIFIAYVTTAVLVISCDLTWIRWLNLLAFLSVTVAALMHQISHIRNGQVHAFAPEVLYLAHHLLGAYMTFLTYRWVRCAARP